MCLCTPFRSSAGTQCTPCRVVAFLVDTSTCMRDSTNGQGRCCVGHYDMNVLALLEGRLHGNTFIVTNLLLADNTSVCFTQAYCTVLHPALLRFRIEAGQDKHATVDAERTATGVGTLLCSPPRGTDQWAVLCVPP